jgi:hypothetical protein
MALKDRLESLKHPGGLGAVDGDRTLTVIPGLRSEVAPAAPAPAATATEDPHQKGGRMPSTLASTKAAIHALLVERHADEIDIGDRDGVRSLITGLTEEYMRTASIALTRLDYGHLIDALLDEVLGLGPLQPLLEDPAISEVMINHAHQVFVERRGRVASQRRPAAARTRWALHDDPQVLKGQTAAVGFAGHGVRELRHDALPRGGGPEPAQHPRLGRHLLWQNDAAEHPLELHPGG